MGTYRLTEKADADLENLYRYGISKFGELQADRYFDRILSRLEEIGDNPLRFQKSEYRNGYRRSVHDSHTIYFQVLEDELVEIVRILGGQDPREEF